MTTEHTIHRERVKDGAFGDVRSTCSCGWTWITNSKSGLTHAERSHIRRVFRQDRSGK